LNRSEKIEGDFGTEETKDLHLTLSRSTSF